MTEIKWAESAHHLPIEGFSPNPKNPKKHTKSNLSISETPFCILDSLTLSAYGAKTTLWWKDMDGWKR